MANFKEFIILTDVELKYNERQHGNEDFWYNLTIQLVKDADMKGTSFLLQIESTPVTVNVCCEGDYGVVAYGCTGECPTENSAASSLCGGRNCRHYMCDRSRVDDSYTKYVVHENHDDAELLFRVNATCFVQRTCSNCNCPCSSNEPCTSCTVSNTHLFEVRNGVEIWRRQCDSDSSEVGCLDADESYTEVDVTCTAAGSSGEPVATSFTIDVEAAEEPNITFPESLSNETTSISGGLSRGSKILEVDLDLGKKPGPVNYTLTGVTSPTSGRDLFIFNETSKAVEVAEDLTDEATHTYNVTLCVITRRSTMCETVTIHLERLRYCKAIGAHSGSASMDAWCETNCKHSEPNCPPTHCHCSWEVVPVRNECTPTPPYDTVPGMDDWCDLNCNAEDPVNCVPSFCTCDPPLTEKK